MGQHENAKEGQSRLLYPMLLGGVSALSILAITSFLIAMYKDRCCHKNTQRRQKYDSYHKMSTVGRVRSVGETTIAYDIPARSKAMISTVWQQEDNDVADEVKTIYRNISDSSKPVLFGVGTGVFLQQQQQQYKEQQQQHKEQQQQDAHGGDFGNEDLQLNNDGLDVVATKTRKFPQFGRKSDKKDEGKVLRGEFMLKTNTEGIMKIGAQPKRGWIDQLEGSRMQRKGCVERRNTSVLKNENDRNVIATNEQKQIGFKLDKITFPDEKAHHDEGEIVFDDGNENAGLVEVPENTLSKVQDWVNSSFRKLEDGTSRNNLAVHSGYKVSLHSDENSEDCGDGKEKAEVVGGGFETDSREDKEAAMDADVNNATGDVVMDSWKKNDNVSVRNAATNAATCTTKATDETAASTTKKSELSASDKHSKATNLRLSSIEDFQKTPNVKGLILTRWVDHAAQHQRKLGVEEEHSSMECADATTCCGVEQSSNELQYEEVDSILTSISRMDEKRVRRLKSTEFYKDLLLNGVRKRIAENSKSCSTTDVDKGNRGALRNGSANEMKGSLRVGERFARQGNEDRQNQAETGSKFNDEKNRKFGMLHKVSRNDSVEDSGTVKAHGNGVAAFQHFQVLNEAKRDLDNTRCSLSESAINEDESSLDSSAEGFAKSSGNLGKMHESASEVSSEQDLNDANTAHLKYSIVRNFSNRFKPFVYVSLTHIQGLDRLAKSSSFFVRIYLANDENSRQQSELLSTSRDVYMEDMFAIQGTSTKDILNDSLVIEVVGDFKSEREAVVARVSVDLSGLRYKATLLSTVEMIREA
eukprot:gene10036-11062_t